MFKENNDKKTRKHKIINKCYLIKSHQNNINYNF